MTPVFSLQVSTWSPYWLSIKFWQAHSVRATAWACRSGMGAPSAWQKKITQISPVSLVTTLMLGLALRLIDTDVITLSRTLLSHLRSYLSLARFILNFYVSRGWWLTGRRWARSSKVQRAEAAARHQGRSTFRGLSTKIFNTGGLSPDNPRYPQISPDIPRYPQISPDIPRYPQMTPDIPRYSQICPRYHRYPHISPDKPPECQGKNW